MRRVIVAVVAVASGAGVLPGLEVPRVARTAPPVEWPGVGGYGGSPLEWDYARAVEEAAQAVRAAEEAARVAQEEQDAREAAEAAQRAYRAPIAAPQPAAPAATPSADCGGVNPYAAYIYQRESGCRTDAYNPGGCRGLGQACPGSKLPCSDHDFGCQHAWFEGYALARYGSWEAAYQFWIGNHWW